MSSINKQEVLEQAIQKAVDGGWQTEWDIKWLSRTHELEDQMNNIIFNHDFAKALWGERCDDQHCVDCKATPLWKFHLQLMVVSPDPIEYLSKHLAES